MIKTEQGYIQGGFNVSPRGANGASVKIENNDLIISLDQSAGDNTPRLYLEIGEISWIKRQGEMDWLYSSSAWIECSENLSLINKRVCVRFGGKFMFDVLGEGEGGIKVGFNFTASCEAPPSSAQDYFSLNFKIISSSPSKPVSPPTSIAGVKKTSKKTPEIEKGPEGEKEEEAWQLCKQRRYSLECLDEFLRQFPSGRYSMEARAKIQDHQYWQTADAKNTVEGYEEYLSIYKKDGLHKDQAEAKIRELESSAPDIQETPPSSRIERMENNGNQPSNSWWTSLQPFLPWLLFLLGISILWFWIRVGRRQGRVSTETQLQSDAGEGEEDTPEPESTIEIGKQVEEVEEAIETLQKLGPEKVGEEKTVISPKLTEAESPGIRIWQHRPVSKSVEAFASQFVDGSFLQLSLENLWLDSAVKDIFVSRKCVEAIDSFIRQQHDSFDEREGALPEIGGFLMGKMAREPETEKFLVSMEEFVAVRPESHNIYQLEFSTQSLAQELGEAQDNFPDLALVGWFHTHPGHGLFLSKPDLTIQNGFFKQLFQFAMEIDTHTENLDTAFFTRQQKGRSNNQQDRQHGVGWFAWTEIRAAIHNL